MLGFRYNIVNNASVLAKRNNGPAKSLKAASKVIASMVPILVMIVLYVADSVEKKLGLTVMFSGLFSALLLYFTSASMKEVFATTAA
ncbi:hypothetical protein B0J14DRAFT_596301 [Halenospora varia]|nr:hypothetical protein B0J14DRAFT_596301 [Halenospora varia]